MTDVEVVFPQRDFRGGGERKEQRKDDRVQMMNLGSHPCGQMLIFNPVSVRIYMYVLHLDVPDSRPRCR